MENLGSGRRSSAGQDHDKHCFFRSSAAPCMALRMLTWASLRTAALAGRWRQPCRSGTTHREQTWRHTLVRLLTQQVPFSAGHRYQDERAMKAGQFRDGGWFCPADSRLNASQDLFGLTKLKGLLCCTEHKCSSVCARRRCAWIA